MPLVVTGTPHRSVTITEVDEGGSPGTASTIDAKVFPDAVERLERSSPRWVWSDTRVWYPTLLDAGVSVERCTDLRLCHRILALSTATQASDIAGFDPGLPDEIEASGSDAVALFDGLDLADAVPADELDCVAWFSLQRRALDDLAGRDSGAAARLQLLLAAESSGALIAEELRHDGMPWRVDIHERVLESMLGPRPRFGGRPAKLEALANDIRRALGAPTLNPDSQPDLLRALGNAGLAVTSTSKWELQEKKHPVVAPLLEYKKLARLLSANGWAWIDEWIRDGRFRPEYVVGGVVTGRWATRGGGALQLPAQIRSAVTADDGWSLIVADAAQLEPRIIAAMARDESMAAAGHGKDLYQGFVDAKVVDTRAHAKVAMLGALYGATTGESAAMMPRLARAYPRAIGLVETAARAGERGDQVSTWLGRSSPRPGERWWQAQRTAALPTATDAEQRRAATLARDWGRFTRNFVAQGTAAEWALCWMAGLRLRLRALADASGTPALAYFLHDEVLVHAPEALASAAADAVSAAAADAGRLLFGSFPVDFALNVAIVHSYAEAK